ncbi:hypothetical protein DFP72DRAFT_1067147 [Ephemerocybe angulata]|uniref:Uncharacterized protein n=1 Tax=Ephemerocybe angulata TaxID=980116 RepID=A0A8H6M5T1_9AGAR|nr:hypothetical protein DFP72DRAFT_1067147 [Tulosesus angulatus]
MRGTCLAVTGTAPGTFVLLNPVNANRVSVHSVKPGVATLTSVIATDLPVLGSVISQHEPQFAELKPSTGNPPPTSGKLGTFPKVGQREASPLDPVEQAVVVSATGAVAVPVVEV